MMAERRKLNLSACNFEQVRAVIRDIDTNFAALFDEVKKLRAELTPRDPGVRPT